MAAHRAHGRGWSYACLQLPTADQSAGGRHRAPVRRRRHRPSLAALLATLSVGGGVTLLVPTAQAADVASDAAVVLQAGGPPSGTVMAVLLIAIGAITFALVRRRRSMGYRPAGRHL